MQNNGRYNLKWNKINVKDKSIDDLEELLEEICALLLQQLKAGLLLLEV